LLYDVLFVALVLLWAVGAGLWPAAARSAGPSGEIVWPWTTWRILGQAMTVVALAQVAVHGAGLLRPDLARARIVADGAVKMAALVTIGWFVSRRPWLEVSAMPDETADRVSVGLNAAVAGGLAVVAGVAMLGLVWDAARLLRGGAKQAPPPGVGGGACVDLAPGTEGS
jgi:hypothetical protein